MLVIAYVHALRIFAKETINRKKTDFCRALILQTDECKMFVESVS